MTLPALLSRKDDRNTGNPWIETAEFIHGKKGFNRGFSQENTSIRNPQTYYHDIPIYHSNKS